MFLRWRLSVAFSKMNAAPIHAFSTPLRPPPHASFLSITRQFPARSFHRLYASSSEPPYPLLHPHLVPEKPNTVKDATISKDGCMPASEQELLKEAATKEFQEASEPRLIGRQRKRRVIVPQVPKRLYSEEQDLGYMQEALLEAAKAAKKGEVPVGAVLVHKNKIIARFHNL